MQYDEIIRGLRTVSTFIYLSFTLLIYMISALLSTMLKNVSFARRRPAYSWETGYPQPASLSCTCSTESIGKTFLQISALTPPPLTPPPLTPPLCITWILLIVSWSSKSWLHRCLVYVSVRRQSLMFE